MYKYSFATLLYVSPTSMPSTGRSTPRLQTYNSGSDYKSNSYYITAFLQLWARRVYSVQHSILTAVGRESVFSIAAGYGLGSLGIKSQQRVRSSPGQTSHGTKPASCTMGKVSLFWE
jgi:hypothetical protein